MSIAMTHISSPRTTASHHRLPPSPPTTFATRHPSHEHRAHRLPRARAMPLARRRPPLSSPHPHARLLAAALIFGLTVTLLPRRASPPITAVRECPLHSVQPVDKCRPSLPRPHPSHPCRWAVHVLLAARLPPPLTARASSRRVRPRVRVRVRALRLRTLRERPLRPPELAVLLRAAGCRSAVQCNASVPCAVASTPEDPSDAFWVNAYNHDSKFVVLFNAGLASLIFYVSAIIADGALFHPHRPGFAVGSATVLILLALSALLYVLIIPPNLQFALYGNGPLQSFAYICAIILIASILPALAVTWISIVMFLAFLLGFLFEHVVYILFGTVHFIASLSAYQFSTTLLNLRFVYLRDIEDDPDFHRRLLDLSTVFLNRVRNNWFMTRIPRMLGHTAVQLMENSLPIEVFDQIEHEPIPHIDFEALDNSETAPTTSERPRQSPPPSPSPPHSQTDSPSPSSLSPSSSSTQPLRQPQSEPTRATDSTPLLQPNSRT